MYAVTAVTTPPSSLQRQRQRLRGAPKRAPLDHFQNFDNHYRSFHTCSPVLLLYTDSREYVSAEFLKKDLQVFVQEWMQRYDQVMQTQPSNSNLDWNLAVAVLKKLLGHDHLHSNIPDRLKRIVELMDHMCHHYYHQQQRHITTFSGPSSSSSTAVPPPPRHVGRTILKSVLAIWRSLMVPNPKLIRQQEDGNAVNWHKFTKRHKIHWMSPRSMLERANRYTETGFCRPHSSYYNLILYVMNCIMDMDMNKHNNKAKDPFLPMALQMWNTMMQKAAAAADARGNGNDDKGDVAMDWHPTWHTVQEMIQLWSKSCSTYNAKEIEMTVREIDKLLEPFLLSTQQEQQQQQQVMKTRTENTKTNSTETNLSLLFTTYSRTLPPGLRFYFAILHAYARLGCMDRVLKWYHQLTQEFLQKGYESYSNITTYNQLLRAILILSPFNNTISHAHHRHQLKSSRQVMLVVVPAIVNDAMLPSPSSTTSSSLPQLPSLVPTQLPWTTFSSNNDDENSNSSNMKTATAARVEPNGETFSLLLQGYIQAQAWDEALQYLDWVEWHVKNNYQHGTGTVAPHNFRPSLQVYSNLLWALIVPNQRVQQQRASNSASSTLQGRVERVLTHVIHVLTTFSHEFEPPLDEPLFQLITANNGGQRISRTDADGGKSNRRREREEEQNDEVIYWQQIVSCLENVMIQLESPIVTRQLFDELFRHYIKRDQQKKEAAMVAPIKTREEMFHLLSQAAVNAEADNKDPGDATLQILNEWVDACQANSGSRGEWPTTRHFDLVLQALARCSGGANRNDSNNSSPQSDYNDAASRAEAFLRRMSYDPRYADFHCRPNKFSYTVVIMAYAKSGRSDAGQKALGLLLELQQMGAATAAAARASTTATAQEQMQGLPQQQQQQKHHHHGPSHRQTPDLLTYLQVVLAATAPHSNSRYAGKIVEQVLDDLQQQHDSFWITSKKTRNDATAFTNTVMSQIYQAIQQNHSIYADQKDALLSRTNAITKRAIQVHRKNEDASRKFWAPNHVV